MFNKETKICFIGSGWIGQNLYNNFKERGFNNLLQYSLDPKFISNKELVKDYEIVFICVPTPTTPFGFQYQAVVEALSLCAPKTVVAIKSTLLPDINAKLQDTFKDLIIFQCPEFLSRPTAKLDTDSPERNLIGVSDMNNKELIAIAEDLLSILPVAKYNKIMNYNEAVLTKYASNCFFYAKNMFFNTLYDVAMFAKCDWDILHEAILADSRITSVHTNPIDENGQRGAGGGCLIKDEPAFREYVQKLGDTDKTYILQANEQFNLKLLRSTGKDLDIVKEVYGE